MTETTVKLLDANVRNRTFTLGFRLGENDAVDKMSNGVFRSSLESFLKENAGKFTNILDTLDSGKIDISVDELQTVAGDLGITPVTVELSTDPETQTQLVLCNTLRNQNLHTTLNDVVPYVYVVKFINNILSGALKQEVARKLDAALAFAEDRHHVFLVKHYPVDGGEHFEVRTVPYEVKNLVATPLVLNHEDKMTTIFTFNTIDVSKTRKIT